jgi:hypothetical protein
MMTDEEYTTFRQELRAECGDLHLLDELLEDVKKRDAELATLLVNAANAEKAIAAYLREKDGN